MEYVTNYHGDLIFQGLASSHIQEQEEPVLPIMMSDRISELSEDVIFFDPPTTHLIANIDDLEGAT